MIPTSRSLHGPGQPGVAREQAEAAGLGPEHVPGGAGGLHHRLVASGEHAVAQPPLAQVQLSTELPPAVLPSATHIGVAPQDGCRRLTNF
jgi:hypothetical protein